MATQPVPLRTPAEMALADAYVKAKSSLPGSDLVRGERARAYDRFHEKGLPHRRIEAWHYTDLRNLMRDAYPAVEAAPVAASAGLRVVICDGAASLSNGALPKGLVLSTLRDCLSNASDAFVRALFPEQGSDDAMVAFNAAMVRDGVVIDVAEGAVIEAPIELHFTSQGDAPHGDVSRVLVRMGAGARAMLHEVHSARGKVQRNSAVVAYVGANAELQHVFETRDSQPEVHVSSLIVDIAKEGSFQSFAYVDAGDVLRRQLFVRGGGEYAKIGLRGVSLLKGKQHADTTLVVDHAVPHGESRELFKHIIDGEASGVYQGKVLVRQHAQKTDGGMKSQALLLSDESAMYNKPELEIFADDVVCGHGATVGQLDEDQLFYLMARGIPRVEAEALMIEGFAREALEFVENDALREHLGQQLSSWLARRAKA